MTTPVEMPNPLPVNEFTFELVNAQNMTPITGGFIQTIDRAPPMWVAKYQTPPLDATREKAMMAFLDSLDGSRVPFLGFHPRRGKTPANYPTGVGYGTPVLYSASYASAQGVIHGLTVGATLVRGDFVAYQVSNAWYLHRLTADVTADGSGFATAAIWPRPPDVLAGANLTIRMNRAAAAMKLIGKPVISDKLADLGPTVSFQAAQFVDRS